MTVNPRVNPKKLRPYDTRPKRRRSLIPGAPDSAATGFLAAAGLWFALATGLGVLAIALRIGEFKINFPLGLFELAFQLDERRVDAAFVNATVYGWLTNAGFAAIAFMAPRLTGRRLVGEAGMNTGLAIWNLSLLGGIGALYVFDLGPNQPLTAMPWLMTGGLAFGALLVTASTLATIGPALRAAYVSLWFGGVALLGLLGILGLVATVGLVDWFLHFDELPLALFSAFVERAIPTLWLLGMAYATLHYVVPRAAGQALASGGLAILTWLSWLLLAPVSALAVLADPSIPFFIATLGSVGTMLLLLPASLAAANLTATIRRRSSVILGPGPAAAAFVSLVFLLASSLLAGIRSLEDVALFVGGTEWDNGFFIWTMYGAFTLAAVALTQHALPRTLKRAWSPSLLSAATMWLVFIGVTVAGVALMGGGIAEGSFFGQGAVQEDIDAGILGYRAVAFGAFGLVALGSLAHLADMFLLYTSARPVAYAVAGAPAAAAASH
jgi:cytochrome c oxidase cbb3-type subunit I